MNKPAPADERIVTLENELAKARRKIDRLLARIAAQTEEARQQSIQCQTAQKSKDEFLSTISHELRTPMNGVLGMAELLLLTKLDPSQQQWVAIIQESGVHLLGIIGDLLDVASIRSGRFHLEPEPFNLAEKLETLRSVKKIEAGAKNLKFRCDLAPETPVELVGDVRRLMQVLDNLVDNAIQFTTAGSVCVQVGVQEEDSQGLVLRLAVQDTGSGISKEHLTRIFERFTQADGSHTRAHRGVGLGLSIAADLVNLMGGRLHIESQEGVGSVFSFTVRLQRTTAPTAKGLRIRALGDIVLRVLVVVADEALRHSLAAHLRGWGLRAEEAATPEDAFLQIMLACQSGDPFRMIVLDREQKKSSGGRTLFEAIAADRRANGTRLIWLTHETESEWAAGDADDPATAVLRKPIDLDQFYRSIQRLLGVVPDAQAAAERGGAAPTPVIQRKDAKILVVEDEMVSQMVVKAFLHKLGVSHDMVGNLAQASQALEDGTYDLVFLAANRWSESELPELGVPLVLMTPGDFAGSTSGARAQISKPLNLWQLARVLNQHL